MVIRTICALVLIAAFVAVVRDADGLRGRIVELERNAESTDALKAQVAELEKRAEKLEMKAFVNSAPVEEVKSVEIPADVVSKIRAKMEDWYPGDFLMQKSAIELQVQAWKELHPVK